MAPDFTYDIMTVVDIHGEPYMGSERIVFPFDVSEVVENTSPEEFGKIIDALTQNK